MFGYKLKYLREQDGLSQSQLAKNLNVQTSTISNWENNRGEPTFDKLKEIADYFTVSIDYLLDYTDDNEKEIEEMKQMIKNVKKSDLKKALKIIEMLKSKEDE